MKRADLFPAIAWWVTPEGAVVPLEDGELHADAAVRLMHDDDSFDPEREYISRGAVRIRNWDRVLFITCAAASPDTFSKIKTALKEIAMLDETHVFIDIVRGPGNTQKARTTVGELLDSRSWRDLIVESRKARKLAERTTVVTVNQLRQFIREALSLNDGYWVTPDGDVVGVRYYDGHKFAAAELMGVEYNEWSQIDYEQAFIKKGAVMARKWSGWDGPMDGLTICVKDQSPFSLKQIKTLLSSVDYADSLSVSVLSQSSDRTKTTAGNLRDAKSWRDI